MSKSEEIKNIIIDERLKTIMMQKNVLKSAKQNKLNYNIYKSLCDGILNDFIALMNMQNVYPPDRERR